MTSYSNLIETMRLSHPGHGISHLGELCSPEAQNLTNRRTAASIADIHQSPALRARSPSVEAFVRHTCPRHVWIYGRPRRRTYLFITLCVCMVTDEDKASGIKFCMAVYRHPGQGISNFGERCFPKIGRIRAQLAGLG